MHSSRLVPSLLTAIILNSLSGCHPGFVHNPEPPCRVSFEQPRRLVLQDGRNVYVEPTAYAESAGALLILGTPTFLWNSITSVTADSVVGVVVGRDSVVRLVNGPVDPRLFGLVEAVARPGGGWDVVFTERGTPAAPGRSAGVRDSIAKIWYGVYDGHEWSALQQLPVPPGLRALSEGSADLVRAGNDLVWAVRVQTALLDTRVLLIRFQAGKLTSETVPTQQASYVALGVSESGEVVLAVVGPDRSEMRDDNSLFLWRGPMWAARRRISFGNREGPAHHPSIVGSNPAVLTWYVDKEAGREARALWDPENQDLSYTEVIDPQYGNLGKPSVVQAGEGRFAWITHHDSDDGIRQIQVATAAAHRPLWTHSIPSPFRTSIRALKSAGSKILIIGGIQSGPRDGVTTAVLETQLVCP